MHFCNPCLDVAIQHMQEFEHGMCGDLRPVGGLLSKS